MIDEENFEIKLPQFEGPFDLLLFFIERDELSIHEISISKITDDFLSFLRQMTSLNMDIASEFIYVAATLMRIKSKMLLPVYTQDDETHEINSKEDLIRKLILYKQFKQVCEDLKVLEEERFKQHARGNTALDYELLKNNTENGEELQSISLYKILKVYTRLMKNFQAKNDEVIHSVIRYPYNIEQQKAVIANLLALNKKLDFDAFYKLADNKVHFVYNFLAMLEMLQQELIKIQIGIGFNNFTLAGHNKHAQ